MGGANFVKLSEDEYRRGLDQRLFSEDVEPQTWYDVRETSQDARSLGCYAIETTVNVKYIQTVKDGDEMCMQVVGVDGRLAIVETRAVLDYDGMLFDRADPSSEGYLLEYPGYPDLPVHRLVERIQTYTAIHES